MKRVWLVLVLALLMSDFTAASAGSFTIATSAEQDAVLQSLTDSANAARTIENARIAEETARLATLTPPQPPGVTNPTVYGTATAIRFTAVGGGASFTAGVIRVVVHYISLTPPTS